MSIETETKVFCTLDFEATHSFPEAPNFCLQSYLEHPHRHIFKIRCEWKVNHTNRDIEFIDAKHGVLEFLEAQFPKGVHHVRMLGAMSCEALATLILTEFKCTKVEVSEDGENGAVVKVL